MPRGPVSPLQAQAQLQESSQKLDLLRLALEKLLEGLPPAHPLRGRVARELRTAMSGNPQPSGTLVKPTAMTGSQESLPHQSSPSLPERTLKHSGEELWRRVPTLAPPLPSCVTWDTDTLSLNLSVSIYKIGIITAPTSYGCCENSVSCCT